jgi:hypothetical protein
VSCTLSIVLVRLWPAEVGPHAIAKILGDIAAKTLNSVSRGAMITDDYLAPFLATRITPEEIT